MKTLKKSIILIFISLLMVPCVTGCSNKENDSNKISIVSTIFPGYDFARAVGGDNVNLTMLLKPGSETHSYDPTPKDIIKIQESDIFIYTGGESDSWVDEILESIDSKKTTVIKMMDLVEIKEEEIVEGMQENHEKEDHEEEEYDEHVWTSPVNAIKIVRKIEKLLIEIDEENISIYERNSLNYVEKIESLDQEIRNIVSNAKRTELIFADRFPFRYFVDEYGLTYRAAFPGCSNDTEINAKTIAFLIDMVKEKNTPVVFYLELSNQKIANTIIEDTNIKKLPFHSAHNVTKKEFESGITYVDIMKNNIRNLKEALN